jgi:hypothetical protein
MLIAEVPPAVAMGIISVVLLLGGLGIMVLSGKAGAGTLASTVFWWLGLLVAILGAVLLLAPIIAWIAAQLRSMLGL